MNANYSEALEQQLALRRWLADSQNYEVVRGPRDSERTSKGLRKLPGGATVSEVIATEGTFVMTRETLLWSKRIVDEASPYFWGDQPCELLETAAPNLPDLVLSEELLPSKVGFCWFHRKLKLPVITGQPDASLCAFGWYPTARGVALSAFLRTSHWWALPMFTIYWSFSDAWRNMRQAFFDPRYPGSSATQLSRSRIQRVYEYFGAALAFMNQRILVDERKAAEPRSLARLGHGLPIRPAPDRDDSSIRVIHLRRAVSSATERAEGEIHGWHFRWIVRGHWRQQPYGQNRAKRQPVWITPYVKGPDDKPLKAPRATVFAVVR
jgi:hypothetical protein